MTSYGYLRLEDESFVVPIVSMTFHDGRLWIEAARESVPRTIRLDGSETVTVYGDDCQPVITVEQRTPRKRRRAKTKVRAGDWLTYRLPLTLKAD